ncbi:protein PAL OF QUIRKY-like [Rutidosis leptorrhynchoides]|uniref:protein PAL OF QUIRKY-like n=1 Tax=Rutidosis leptorrhynchoides TaxID=125765 RepID=UPI003A98F6BD
MGKLRLMCCNGGHIVPRPHDKTLCYIGGETRMISVESNITLLDLTQRLSKTLIQQSSQTTSFTIKYQLPSEDLDSLISVTTDEDLENMIEEYERLTSSSSTAVGKSSRLRLFIFPNNPESVNSIGSILENSAKSDDWFVNALNGTNSGFSNTSSGNNCLLNLDDDDGDNILPPEKTSNYKNAIGVDMNSSGQDVHSVPNSPMLDTTSSFGSASSTPSLSNLPPTSSAPVMDSVLSDSTITDQLSPLVPLQPSSNTTYQASDQSSPRIQMQQLQLQNPTYLMSTQMDTFVPQISHNQQMQYFPQPQYIHHTGHQPSGIGPVTSYYHPQQLPIDQQNYVYYIPTRQPQQGYNFPLHQPQPNHADIPNNQGAAATEFMAGGYRGTNPGSPQLVRVLSSRRNQPQYAGYSEIHQPSHSQYSNDR